MMTPEQRARLEDGLALQQDTLDAALAPTKEEA